MNSLSPSRSRQSYSITHQYHTSENTGAIQPIKPLSPIVIWTVYLGLAFSLLLVAVFCSQPLSVGNLTSDFHAGVDGIRELVYHNVLSRTTREEA